MFYLESGSPRALYLATGQTQRDVRLGADVPKAGVQKWAFMTDFYNYALVGIDSKNKPRRGPSRERTDPIHSPSCCLSDLPDHPLPPSLALLKLRQCCMPAMHGGLVAETT